MPSYQYRCNICGTETSRIMPMAQYPLKTAPLCSEIGCKGKMLPKLQGFTFVIR